MIKACGAPDRALPSPCGSGRIVRCLLLEEKVPSAARRMRCFLTLRTPAGSFLPILDRQPADEVEVLRLFPALPVVRCVSNVHLIRHGLRRATFPSRGRQRQPALHRTLKGKAEKVRTESREGFLERRFRAGNVRAAGGKRKNVCVSEYADIFSYHVGNCNPTTVLTMGQCGGSPVVFYPFLRQSSTARMRARARASAASGAETFISMPRVSRSDSARRSAASSPR